MDRKNFLKNACGLGFCSCLGIGLLHSNNSVASNTVQPDWKEHFIKHRFAKLIDILDSTLDKKTKNQIIENLGKECSLDSIAKNYINNPEGFLNEINRRWGEISTYDKEKGLIRVRPLNGIVFVHLSTAK